MNPFTAALERSKTIESRTCSENTQRVYRSGLSTYKRLYDEYFADVEAAPPVWPPTLEGMLALFTLVAEERDYRYGSLANIAKSISYYCRLEEIDNPTRAARWVAFIRGLKKDLKGDYLPNSVEPILIVHLQMLIDSEELKKQLDYTMLIALFTLQFWGFLRIGEVLALRWNNIEISDETKTITIEIRDSKTDPTGKGAKVHIFPSQKPVHPLQHLLQWKDQCQTTHVFPVSPDTVRIRLSLYLKTLGVVGRYSTHSFRKGGAHAAALNGASDASIKTHGRWRSSVYIRYTSLQMEEAGSMVTTLI